MKYPGNLQREEAHDIFKTLNDLKNQPSPWKQQFKNLNPPPRSIEDLGITSETRNVCSVVPYLAQQHDKLLKDLQTVDNGIRGPNISIVAVLSSLLRKRVSILREDRGLLEMVTKNGMDVVLKDIAPTLFNLKNGDQDAEKSFKKLRQQLGYSVEHLERIA